MREKEEKQKAPGVKNRYPKGSAWKRANWDKWSFWRKVLHVFCVIQAIKIILIMCYLVLVFALIVLGIQDIFTDIRNKIILDIIHFIFGG